MSELPTPALRQLLCLDLYAASRAIIKAYGPLLKKVGLTYPQYLVMVALWEGSPLSVQELCQKLSLDSGTLSPLLKRLEAAKFIERTRNEKDERRVDITLTSQGSALRACSAEVMKEMVCHLAMPLEDIQQLQVKLREITRRFEE